MTRQPYARFASWLSMVPALPSNRFSFRGLPRPGNACPPSHSSTLLYQYHRVVLSNTGAAAPDPRQAGSIGARQVCSRARWRRTAPFHGRRYPCFPVGGPLPAGVRVSPLSRPGDAGDGIIGEWKDRHALPLEQHAKVLKGEDKPIFAGPPAPSGQVLRVFRDHLHEDPVSQVFPDAGLPDVEQRAVTEIDVEVGTRRRLSGHHLLVRGPVQLHQIVHACGIIQEHLLVPGP